MKLFEIINYEELKSGQIQRILGQKSKSISNFIENHCSQILDIYWKEQKYLYRGVNLISTSQFMLGNSRDNRSPKDTPKEVQLLIDKRLQEAGFEARRSNSIFCTSNLYTAEAYAIPLRNVFIIFPINGFSFTYNSMARDLYTYYGLKRQLDRTDSVSSFMRELNDDSISSDIFCSKYGFEKTNLGYGISNLREIYINGKYVAIKIKTKLLDHVLEDLNLSEKTKVNIDQDGVVAGE